MGESERSGQFDAHPVQTEAVCKRAAVVERNGEHWATMQLHCARAPAGIAPYVLISAISV
jgi:hypothetical protein